MNNRYIVFPEKNLVSCEREQLEARPLESNEVLIRSETSIISPGTELARLKGLEPGTAFPLRPGYGTIGIIEAMGSGVAGFNVGDRVFFAGRHAEVQRFSLLPDNQWAHLFSVPEGIDSAAAALACMVEIAMTAPNFSKVRLGDTVAVFGLGIVGLLTALLYQLKGARVIGADPIAERGRLASELGIDEIVGCAPAGQVEAIRALTGGRGADLAVDAVGHSAVIRNAVQATRDLGEILLLGSPRVPVEGDLTSVFWDVHLNGKVLRGAHMHRYPVAPQRGAEMDVEWAFDLSFRLIQSGKLSAGKLITHVVAPDEVPEVYRRLQTHPHEYMGVVIDWR